MQKTQLIDAIAKESGMTKVDAAKAVNATLKVIQTTLTGGEKITIPGFGTFVVRERGERTVPARPGSTEKITVPPTKYAAFSAGSDLKAAVSGKAKEVATTTDKAETESAAPVAKAEVKEKAETKPKAKSKSGSSKKKK